MGLDKIEDLLRGEVELLTYLVYKLYNDGRKHEAKGVYMRHKLEVDDFSQNLVGKSRVGVAKDIENMKYDKAKDF
jgi:hypothetical protein